MKLNHLPDRILLNDTLQLANQERVILAKLLWHLKEVGERKLYSDLKCESLFEYCIRVLKYSEGQASRRVSACRILKDMPEIAFKIEAGDLNLMQLNIAKQFFEAEGMRDRKEKLKVLEDISGKTYRETEKQLAGKKKIFSPEKVKIEIKQETLDALKKIQGLKAHCCKDLDMLILKMCEEVSYIWDPTVVRRKSKLLVSNTRYVPVQVRSAVWKRDKGKCKVCASTFALEMDHIRPFAMGGRTELSNLQLLCRNCNQRKGIVNFGYREITRGI